jgi:hypothetical protein
LWNESFAQWQISVMEGFEPFFSIKHIFSGLPNGQPEAHRSMTSSFLPPNEAGLRLGKGIIGSYDAAPPFLSGSQYFCSSDEVEGQLSELAINAIYDHLGNRSYAKVAQSLLIDVRL